MSKKKKDVKGTMVDFSRVAKTLEEVNIDEYMRKSFLNYAFTVIESRSLPDARDGLKPVHRRILYTMKNSGYTFDKKHVKSSRIVGEVMGKLHPHGDSAIYGALVGLQQPFNMSVPLVDGYGNFGMATGDGPAAPRYTESRLSREAILLLEELDEDSVDMVPNYDGTETEPDVLPAMFPNLLINGSYGIAVGLACNLPPHNPTEVINGVRHLLKNPDATLNRIMKFVPAPDFPTGAEIIGADMVKEAYETGRGTFRMRARYFVEPQARGKSTIVFYEFPFSVSVEKCIMDAKNAIESGKLQGIADIVDVTDRNNGIRLHVETKMGVNPAAIVEELFSNTSLQSSFGVNNTVIDDVGNPVTVGLLRLMEIFISHRKTVVTRRTKSELKKKSKRLNQVEGLLKVMLDIDAAIAIIRKSADISTAQKKLMTKFKLDEEQAIYVLNLQLRRLTRMDEHALRDEKDAVEKEIERLTVILSTPEALIEVIDAELLAARKVLHRDRNSVVVDGTLAEFVADSKEQVKTAKVEATKDEPCLIHVHASGKVSRTPINRERMRGRANIDPIVATIPAMTRGRFVAVTNLGNGFRLDAALIHEGESVTAKSIGLELARGERVVALSKNSTEKGETGVALGTALGVIKISRTDFPTTLDEFPVINLAEGDEVLGGAWIDSPDDINFVFITEEGLLARFEATKVRPQGSKGGGMSGIKIPDGKKAIAFAAVTASKDAETTVVTYSGSTIKVSTLDTVLVKGRGIAGQRFHTYRKGEAPKLVFAAVAADQVVVDSKGSPVPLPALAKPNGTGTPTSAVPAFSGTL